MANITEFGQKYIADITANADKYDFPLDEYQKQCCQVACSMAFSVMASKGISPDKIDQSALYNSIQSITFLGLNGASFPAEVYADYRAGSDGAKGKLLILPQGDGWQSLVARWGRDLKKLDGPFIVREGDGFELPYYDGEKMVGPRFHPQYKSSKKAIYVFYTVTKTDGSREWLIADRDSVAKSIVAQVAQNVRYSKQGSSMTYAQKNELIESLDGLTTDELLAKPEIKSFINPTYTSPASRESMIITKMKNAALRPYPRDYDNRLQQTAETELQYADGDYGVKKEEPTQAAEPSQDAVADFDAPSEAEPIETEKPKDADDEELPF